MYSQKELSKKAARNTKKKINGVKHGLGIGQKIVKGVSLIATFYGIYTATTTISPTTIIVSTISLICWSFFILLDVAAWLAKRQLKYLWAGFKYDISLGEERERIAKYFSKTPTTPKDKILLKLEKWVEKDRVQNINANIP